MPHDKDDKDDKDDKRLMADRRSVGNRSAVGPGCLKGYQLLRVEWSVGVGGVL
jgi:hypothetical protein